jgi:hypothetical protein
LIDKPGITLGVVLKDTNLARLGESGVVEHLAEALAKLHDRIDFNNRGDRKREFAVVARRATAKQ